MRPSEDKLKQTDFRLCVECEKLHMGLTSCPKCSTPLTLVDYKFFLGKSIGKYTVRDILGIGGMGIVFKAVHQALDKKVAIKIFVATSEDTTFEKRFLREARILAGLKHTNIIEVYDFDVSPWGMPYYVMEYLEGKTLGDIIRKYPRGLSAGIVARYLEPIILGLSHAHNKGIVHRDLKPDNIFIETSGDQEVLKILDFGIAKSVVGDDEAARLTATETVLGTPYYLTPEQILNKNIGPHTDQYALALILGEMLGGQIIRGGKTIGEILYKEVHNPIELETLKRKKIPASVSKVLVKATMPKTTDRYSSIENFGSAVYSALSKADKTGRLSETMMGGKTVKTTFNSQKTARESAPKRPYSPKKTFLSIEEEALRAEKKKRRTRFGVAAAVLLAVTALVVGFLLIIKPGEEKGNGDVTKKNPEKITEQITPPQTEGKGKEQQKQEPGKKQGKEQGKEQVKDQGKKQEKKQEKDKITVPPKTVPLVINASKTLTAPPDTLSILTFKNNNLVLESPESIHVVDLKNAGNPESYPLEERILDGLPGGNIAFIDDYTITSRNFIDNTDNILLRNPPPGEFYKISQSQKYLAAKQTGSLKLFRVSNQKKTRIKAIVLGRSTGFFMQLSDRYFSYINAGRIYAYQLQPGPVKEILNQVFSQSELAVEAMAFHDAGRLLAVGGKFESVYLYYLGKNNAPYTIKPPGQTRALEFLSASAASPTLMMGQKGELLAWKKGIGITATYKTGASTVTDLTFTTGRVPSLIVLSRNPDKIYTFKIRK
ncbi:MAG: serine/threonine protein kinase [bacterium]|nr:serine/threonine protein kinase [bacterium]